MSSTLLIPSSNALFISSIVIDTSEPSEVEVNFKRVVEEIAKEMRGIRIIDIRPQYTVFFTSKEIEEVICFSDANGFFDPFLDILHAPVAC